MKLLMESHAVQKSIKIPVYLTERQVKELDFLCQHFGGESRSSVLRRSCARYAYDIKLKIRLDLSEGSDSYGFEEEDGDLDTLDATNFLQGALN
jgi:hypothetical protein